MRHMYELARASKTTQDKKNSPASNYLAVHQRHDFTVQIVPSNFSPGLVFCLACDTNLTLHRLILSVVADSLHTRVNRWIQTKHFLS